MSRHLDPADEELLQAALSSSFTRLPPASTPEIGLMTPLSATAPTAEPVPEPIAVPPQSTVDASTSTEDSIKDEYDRQLAAWRAEADVARAKAERTRAEWELRRKAEEEEERRRAAAAEVTRNDQHETNLAGWETVSPADDGNKPVAGASVSGGVGTSNENATAQRVATAQSAAQQHEQTFGREVPTPEPSPADVRDFVSGEQSRTGTGPSGLNFPLSSPSTSRTPKLAPGHDSEPSTSEEDEPRISRQWEENEKLGSGGKSIPQSSARKHGEKGPNEHPHHHHHHHDDDASHPHHASSAQNRHQPGPPPSLTLSIFSPGLSPRARALAVISSLAINMFLPFINGVMLGFGEIFAKNFVAPLLGIKVSAPSVANVGLRAGTKEQAKDRRR